MALSITSETGRLLSVLVHLPGQEIDRMLPSMMGELLFDDILFGERAREEHRRFQRILEFVADEVLEFRDLLIETLRLEEAKKAIVSDLATRLQLPAEVLAILGGSTPEELGDRLIEG